MGRAGHRPFSPSPFSLSPTLIRPLLATPRSAIEAYCAEHGLQPRFDRSNEDTTLYRNRLRHELLPILEGYNPRIREVLAHTAEVLAGDHEVLRTAVDEAWDRVRTREGESGGVGGSRPLPILLLAESVLLTMMIHLDLAAWRALPLGLQRATIREAIHRLRASLRNINWEHVERAVWLARDGGTGQKATLAAGLELEIGYRTLRIGPEATPASPLKRASLVQPGDSLASGRAGVRGRLRHLSLRSMRRCFSRLPARPPSVAVGGLPCCLVTSMRFPRIAAQKPIPGSPFWMRMPWARV